MSENENEKVKKNYKVSNGLAVRVMAGFLAFLMVFSMAATVISFFVQR